MIKRKLALAVGIVFVCVFSGFAVASWVLFQNILLTMLLVLASMPFDMYLFYLLLVLRRKPRYPLTSPESKWDMYLPRTNIPRPVYEDFRKLREKEKKFARLDKMLHRKKRRKR